MDPWVAYVDESVRESTGAYVLVGSYFAAGDADLARYEVASLVKPGQRFHWRLSAASAKRRALEVVDSLPARHAVTVGMPLLPGGERRGRRYCLQRLLYELSSRGVEDVLIESRMPNLNREDTMAIDGFRAARIIPRELKVTFGYPAGLTSEPLLWVPDIMAGAIGAELDRGERLPRSLAARVTQYLVTIP